MTDEGEEFEFCSNSSQRPINSSYIIRTQLTLSGRRMSKSHLRRNHCRLVTHLPQLHRRDPPEGPLVQKVDWDRLFLHLSRNVWQSRGERRPETNSDILLITLGCLEPKEFPVQEAAAVGFQGRDPSVQQREGGQVQRPNVKVASRARVGDDAVDRGSWDEVKDPLWPFPPIIPNQGHGPVVAWGELTMEICKMGLVGGIQCFLEYSVQVQEEAWGLLVNFDQWDLPPLPCLLHLLNGALDLIGHQGP